MESGVLYFRNDHVFVDFDTPSCDDIPYRAYSVEGPLDHQTHRRETEKRRNGNWFSTTVSYKTST